MYRYFEGVWIRAYCPPAIESVKQKQFEVKHSSLQYACKWQMMAAYFQLAMDRITSLETTHPSSIPRFPSLALMGLSSWSDSVDYDWTAFHNRSYHINIVLIFTSCMSSIALTYQKTFMSCLCLAWKLEGTKNLFPDGGTESRGSPIYPTLHSTKYTYCNNHGIRYKIGRVKNSTKRQEGVECISGIVGTKYGR